MLLALYLLYISAVYCNLHCIYITDTIWRPAVRGTRTRRFSDDSSELIDSEQRLQRSQCKSTRKVIQGANDGKKRCAGSKSRIGAKGAKWDGRMVVEGIDGGVHERVGEGIDGGIGVGLGEGIDGGIGERIGEGIGEGLGEGIRVGVGEGIGEGLGEGIGEGIGEGLGEGIDGGIGEGLGEGIDG